MMYMAGLGRKRAGLRRIKRCEKLQELRAEKLTLRSVLGCCGVVVLRVCH